MELTAQQIVALQPALQADLPAGAVTAAVEYRTPHGCGYFLVAALLAPEVLLAPDIAALPAPFTLKFLQGETGTWQAVFASPTAAQPVAWEVSGAVILQALEQNGFPPALLEQINLEIQAAPTAVQDAPPWEE